MTEGGMKEGDNVLIHAVSMLTSSLLKLVPQVLLALIDRERPALVSRLSSWLVSALPLLTHDHPSLTIFPIWA